MAIGKYEVLGELGRGANSAIMKVRRQADGRVYALKVVTVATADDLKYVEQLKNEHAVATKLNHPNLLKVHELELGHSLLGRATGGKLLMEFVDGLPLSRCVGLPLVKLLVAFHRASDAFAHMHAAGFYHADIKPDNIMLRSDGEVKVIDFGLVWRRGEDKDRVQGTLEYLAPEQAKRKQVNERTDIFNFGATMYRMLGGPAMPALFQERGASKTDRIDAFVRPLPEYNEAVPADVDQLVRQCVRYRAEERPESMKAIKRGLKHCLEAYVLARRARKAAAAAAQAAPGRGDSGSADEEDFG